MIDKIQNNNDGLKNKSRTPIKNKLRKHHQDQKH